MSAFADKYANAPAIRELGGEEVKVGMVIRLTNDGDEWTGVAFMRVARVLAEIDDIEAEDGTSWHMPLVDRIDLIEDVPDPREELAKRLCTAWHLSMDGGMTGSCWYGVADEAIRWHNEQAQS